MRSTMLVAVMASGMLASVAFGQALPSGGKVVTGTAAITNTGQATLITQSSDKAIIDWQAFSIGQGGTVQFNNGSGATLNRVTGGNLSSIDGLLSATGSVYLINPNGVIIGKTGVVKVGGGFVASTLDIDNTNFLNGGDQTLAGTSLASVVNLGKIGALGGDVALVAANVRNDGTVVAPNGTLGLLAGSRVLMRDSAVNDGKFLVLAGGAGTSATNTGTIEAAAAELRAQGGNIYALAGNTAGLIIATGVSANDGHIFLTAGDGGSTTVSGSTLKASDSAGNGGLISITQGQINVAADATLDASATSATDQGGKISVIADMTSGALDFHGSALAKGGANGGDGGFVETSGHTVDFDGAKVDTSAAGPSGTWLIDPYDLTIDTSAATTIDNALSGNTGVTLKTTSNSASGSGIQNASGNGDIIVNADLSWSGSGVLTLDAYHSIQVNANVTVQANGGVALKTNDGGANGDYAFAYGKSLSYTGSGGSLTINGAGYTLLYSLSDFPQMESSMSNFALAKSIDATGLVYGQAVVHGYSSNSTYAGTFTGLGNTISNLTVSTGGEWGSLFAFSSGTIRDIGLVGGSFSAYTDAAALVTYNYGTIINAWTSSSVSAFVEAGGLVDVNNGTIRNSFSTGVVGGVSGIGGLVSNNSGSITNSYSTATVSNTITQGGGLIAYNNGAVTNSYAAGKVNGAGAQGGLIGQYNAGTITNSYYDSVATGESDTGKGVGTSLTGGTLPSGFAGAGWSVTAGLYPYLTSVGLETISGHAYTGTDPAANATLALYTGGTHLASATATTGVDGSYSIVTMPGTTQAGLLETLNGASSVSGLAYNDNLLGSTLDVTSGTVQYATDLTSYATLKSNAALTFGASTYTTLLTTLAQATYTVNAAHGFTVDSGFESAGPTVIKALGGNLTVSSDQTLTGVTALTLDARNNLAIDGNVTATGAAAVTLKSGDGGSGDYTFALGKSLSFIGTGGSLTVNSAAYTLLYSLSDFSQLESSSGNFALAKSLDAGGATYTTTNLVNNFGSLTTHQGILTGLGHTVSNLNIVKSSNVTGLIGNNYATIRDIGAVGVSASGGAYVGGLVAYNRPGATLANAWSAATVSGTSTYVGGLVGNNQGTISNSFATGKVSGGSQAGGLAGENGGTITNAYATGAVSGTSAVGGIVGENDGTISTAYATGQVTASSNGSGSIGQNWGSSSNVYYDIGTSGVANDGTGMTTSQLQSALPTGFSSSTWAGGGGSLYPYLKTFFPTAIAAVSGTASNNNNAAAAGATLNLYSGGSLQGSAVSGANGYYYIALPLTTNDGQAGITETLSGAGSVSGASFSDNGNLRYGGISGVNVASGAFNEYTSQNSYAAVKTEAASTFGSSFYGSLLTSLAASPFNLYASSYSFTLDSNFDTTSPILVKTLNGNLTVSSDLTLTGTTGLTLEARNNLYIDGNITASGANAVTLIAADSGYGDYSFAYGKSLSYTGSGGSLTINGNPYTLVYAMSSLAGLNNATGRYALATSLDASGTPYSSAVIGVFGNSSSQNAGTLTGLGNTISNLTITGTGNNVGLIGTNYGVVRDLGLTNVKLTTTGTNIGGIAGWNANGTLQNDYVSGTIQGNTAVGGLAGANNLTITNDFSSASVSGQLDVGGLVGVSNSGTISGAYNLGAVTSVSVAGGIAGLNAGATISGVFSAGYISSGDSHAGGIVGQATSGNVYSAYYDNQTSGVSDNGSGYGMSTSQLKNGSMGMELSQNWNGTNGLYPYLTTFGLQTISGYTYASAGVTAQATVGIYSGGSLFSSLTSGSNGAYSLSVLPGTLSPTGELGFVETLNGASAISGATYTDTLKGQVNITAGVLQYTTAAASYSTLQAEAASAFGSSAYTSLETGLAGANTTLVASHAFTFDQAVTFGGNLSVTATGGDIDVNGQISASGNIVLAANGKFVNTAGATALSAGGRFIVYTQDATNPTGALPTDTFNGLVATNYYNDAYDFTGKSFASAVPATGNYFVYGYAARLTPTLSGSVSKTYDGDATTTTSGLSVGSGTLVSGNDSVSLAFTGASFDSKNAGSNKTVTASGISLSSNPNNYILASTTASANIGTINKATVTASLIGTVAKTYDTNATATLASGNYNLAGVLTNDSVSLSDPTSGTYDDKNAGTSKLVSVSGLTLSGTDGGNYSLAATTVSANIGTINKATVTASLTGTVAKTYDTYDTATLASGNYSLSGVLNNETVSLNAPTSGTYDDKNAGSSKLVSVTGLALSGADDGNYILSNASASANIGTINKATVTASLIGTVTKTYDTYDTATLASGNYALSGVLNNEVVGLNSPTSGSYDDKNAASNKLVSVTGLALSGAGDGNYVLASTTASANIGTITKATVTASLIGTVAKTYDTTTAATLASANYNLAGVLTNDSVSLSDPTSGAYDDKNAGTSKLVSVSGLTLSGADGGNYSLASTSASANIGSVSKATVTASLIGTVSKTYDTHTTATLTDSNYSLTGVLNSEAVGLNNPTSGTYDDKNAASGKLVSVSGLTLSGADDGNYVLAATTASANIGTINKATLTASLIGTVSKTYDTNTTAALTDSNYSLAGVLNNEAVGLNNPTSGTYDDKNAASGKLVSVSGLTLSGADDGNYVLAATTASANIGTINKATLTASLIGTVSKAYDTNTTAVLTDSNYSLAGVLNSEAVTVSATSAVYDNKNAASGKLVSAAGLTLAGVDDGNYTLSANTASANIGTIDKATLTASLIGTVSKTYDTNTTATLTDSNYSLAGVLNSEAVTVSATSATYADKNAASNKLVSAAGLSLSGADDGNYTLASTSASANIGTINKATLTASLIGTAAKTYDTNTTATLISGNYSLAGVLNSEAVSVSATSATYADKNAATGKLVSASGLSLSGADDGNYTLASTSASANIGTINKATLTASLIGTATKTYDTNTTATLTSGNYSLAGILNSEAVTVSATSATYADKNAASNKLVSASGLTLAGVDDGNYTLASTSASANIGTINKATLTASLTGTVAKTYDTNTTATLASGNYGLSGILNSEAVSVSATSAVYDNKNAGLSKTVAASGLTLSGADDGNYVLASTSASGAIGTINKATVTASLTGTAAKTYDTNTTATLTSANYKLTGVLGSETVGLSGPTSGTYDTKNAGTSKTVTASGVALSGADDGNYVLAATTASGNIGTINQAILTASLTGTVSKTYDSTITATLGSGNYSLAGVLNSEAVSVSAGSAAYADKNANITSTSTNANKLVSASGLALSGADAGNYALASTSASANIGGISQAALSITLTGTVSKVYDGAKTAILTSSNYATSGVFQGDTVTFTAPTAGLFSDTGVSTGKTITATLAKISGTDAGNYSFNKSISGNIGTITARPVTIAAISTNKNVGDSDPVLGDTLTSGTLVSGDAITGLPARIGGESPGAYAINQGSVAVSTSSVVNPNYNITFIPGTFTVNAAAAKASVVVVTASSTSSGTSTTSSSTGSSTTGTTSSSTSSTTSGTTSGTTSTGTTSSSSGSGSTTSSSGTQSTTGCSGGGCDTPYPSNQLISSSISFATN